MTNQSLNSSITQQPPTVSVIMNCLNGAKYLREAIDSVFTQTYGDWEIIFWDNASTDNSAEIAKSYGEKVRYFRSKETVPLGKARNWAIEKTQGKYIAFLDCDDIWLPLKLEKQIPLFEKNQKVGLVYSNATYFNKKGDVYQLYKRKKLHSGYIFRELFKKYFLCLPTVVIRKEALLNLNQWFDDNFDIVEDKDLFLRIAYNWKVSYADEILVKYRMHEESLTFNKRSLRIEENKILINKLKNLYPVINEGFSYEVKLAESRTSYSEALIYWIDGRRQKVRQLLKPFLKVNKKLFFPYVLSYFLSYRFYAFILRICGKHGYVP